jgi:hypothetical protein
VRHLHIWSPGEICVGPIHLWVRRSDFFFKNLEYCEHCLSVRHREWWDHDLVLVPYQPPAWDTKSEPGITFSVVSRRAA